MTKLAASLFAIATIACTVGEESAPSFVDTDGDGTTDAVDTNGDGSADYSTPSCPTCTPGSGVAVCANPLVDANNDGILEGLDLDCDGTIDIPFGAPTGGTPTTTSQCISTIFSGGTKKQVSCTNGSCECRLNDQLTQTCTATAGTCSVPGNCCGF